MLAVSLSVFAIETIVGQPKQASSRILFAVEACQQQEEEHFSNREQSRQEGAPFNYFAEEMGNVIKVGRLWKKMKFQPPADKLLKVVENRFADVIQYEQT